LLSIIAAKQITLWQHCLDVGAELGKLASVKNAQTAFMTDVQGMALGYLAKNRDYVTEELKGLGDDGATPSPDKDDKLKEVQKMAALVRNAQAKEREFHSVIVGDEFMMPQDSIPFWFRKTFDPDKPPDRNLDKDESAKDRDWAKVRDLWKPVADFIKTAANRYPAIYAAIGQSDSYAGGEDKVGQIAETDPTKARKIIGTSLRVVLNDINQSERKILDNDPDYRDLVPIQAQLLNKTAIGPSGIDWSDAFYEAVARNDLANYKTRQFWVRLGLSAAASAAFVVVEFATAGTATFFIAAGVGLAASGYQAFSSLDRYMALDRVAKTNVKDETALIDKATLDVAGEQAVQDAASFLASAASVGVKLATIPKAPVSVKGGGPNGPGTGGPSGGGAGPGVPGRVQSRINVANGPTRFTPLKDSGNPSKAGWDHVANDHFGGGNTQSQFTQPQGRVKAILQSPDVVASPVTPIGQGPGVQYVRVTDVSAHLAPGEALGTTRVAQGGLPTTWMKIHTDSAGNLITCYPVPKP
jgi:hypothetical protein